MGSEKNISTRSKLLRSAKEQQSCQCLDQISDFKEVYSESVTKALYRSKFWISECIFKLVCHCEGFRLSEIGCA